MLDIIILVVLLLWLGGWVVGVGSHVHLLLIVALVLFIVRLLEARGNRPLL